MKQTIMIGMPESYISSRKDEINWDHLCAFQELPEHFLIAHEEYLNWDTIYISQNLSEYFMRKYQHKWNSDQWSQIRRINAMSPSFYQETKHL